MSEIKIYRVTGTYKLNYKKYLFNKEVRAMTQENALEKVMSQITSIGIMRRQIKLEEIKVISPEECEDFLVRELSIE